MHAGKVLRGVWVGEVALSGLDRSRASEAIAQLDRRLRATPARIRIGSELIEVKPDAVGFRLSVKSTVALALEAGRDTGPFRQMAWWLERWFSPLQLQATAELDADKLAKAVSQWERAGIQDPPFAGGIAVAGQSVQPDYPRVGHTVDQNALRRLLLDALLQERRKVVEVPLVRVAPSLGRAAVDRAVERARKVLSGSIRLVSTDGAHRIELSAKRLARALGTRRSRTSPAELELYLDAERLGSVLAADRERIERDPVDATFAPLSPKRVAVVPGQPAIRLRNDLVATALLQAAHAPRRMGVLPLDRSEQPKLQADDAVALGVRGLVSSFTTHHPCCRPRVDNIHRIADLLDGTLVKPGETFSVNEHVGPRTRKNGFVPAPTIEEGEMVDTVGGGISQFATTMFNAVFYGGYDIIERQPHTYYFARYPMGHEATLSYPKPDLIFRNDTEAGLLIKCEYGKTFIRVKLYGDNGGRKVRAKVSQRTNIKDPPVELIPNPELDPDEEKVKEAGALGWTVVVARVITFADGTKREEKRRVVYNPRVRRVEVHPCRIPEGEEGYTGEDCPTPEEELEETGEPVPEAGTTEGAPAPEGESSEP